MVTRRVFLMGATAVGFFARPHWHPHPKPPPPPPPHPPPPPPPVGVGIYSNTYSNTY